MEEVNLLFRKYYFSPAVKTGFYQCESEPFYLDIDNP
jgi:hypothetical protein